MGAARVPAETLPRAGHDEDGAGRTVRHQPSDDREIAADPRSGELDRDLSAKKPGALCGPGDRLPPSLIGTELTSSSASEVSTRI